MSGVIPVQNENQLEDLAVLNLKPENSGYMYVYVSNESVAPVNFNNLKVAVHPGRVLEENHYYPYGLLIKPLSYSSVGMPLQMYKYNGKELQTELDWNNEEYGARNYDPVTGRWWVVDPLAVKYNSVSPFNYTMGNPVLNVDPDGREVKNGHKAQRDAAVERKSNTTTVLSSLTKGDDGYKRAKKEDRQAGRALNNIDKQYQKVEKAISEVKNDDEKYFNLIDGMKTPKGKSIDVYVYSTQNPQVNKLGAIGETQARFNNESGNYDIDNEFSSPFTSENGANSINISIGSMQGGKTLKHEFGHAEIFGTKGTEYRRYIRANPDQSAYDTDNSSNPSSIRALEAEKSYDGNPATSLIK